MGRQRRYWWVNQGKTFKQEVQGGYLWSPKYNVNGQPIQSYENMRHLAPGDIVFSFKERAIRALGVVRTHSTSCPMPDEFGQLGGNWNKIGWRADVGYKELSHPVLPSKHLELIRPLLPALHTPIDVRGYGVTQYLFEISKELAEVLAGLIGSEADFVRFRQTFEVPDGDSLKTPAIVDDWENHIQQEILANGAIRPTEKVELVRSRRGQGIFRRNLERIEDHCRVTGVDNLEHLIGSHIKPWRAASNQERLDGENGLLLTPSIDHLFDKGFISFEDNGRLLVASSADTESLRRMGISEGERLNVGEFSSGQKKYLSIHRSDHFLG